MIEITAAQIVDILIAVETNPKSPTFRDQNPPRKLAGVDV
jgi:hypothetical protein